MIDIFYDEMSRVFHLKNDKISYIFAIEQGVLVHHYFGRRLAHYNGGRKYPKNNRSGFSPLLPTDASEAISLDAILQEYPNDNHGDYRIPAVIVQNNDGSFITDFRYSSHEIIFGKPPIEGLPSTYATPDNECKTLIVHLLDDCSNIELELFYTLFENNASVIRATKISNFSDTTVFIKKIMSASLDFLGNEHELLYLPGSWARERNIVRESINPGLKVLDSKRGSSSHTINPSIAFGVKNFAESQGQVYSLGLVYSGSFEISVEKDAFEQCRVQAGISSHDFSWKLDSNTSFVTPEVILSYSDEGLNSLSQNIHDLCNHNLIRGTYKHKIRPVLINNWEATYMDFNEDKLITLARKASEFGVELFVLDDGWFGQRNSDNCSLGDWYENKSKFPKGLRCFSNQIHELGMKFGLWFEPEMISKKSDLYKSHPNWIMKIPGRKVSPSRNQYILDFCKKDVRDNIFCQVCKILDKVEVDYVKWDMNRNFSEIYSDCLGVDQQGEISHRYILGLYELMEKLIKKYPNILFEGCSGGGGRFDLGMLSYMPQIWTSDNTDALARIKIQYGTSLFYPISSMGSHVSAIPNHQTQRELSLDLRGNVAMSGVLGYELDVNQLTAYEQAQIAEQIRKYKQYQSLIMFGNFYRLISPFDEDAVSWMFVDKRKDELLVFYAETFKVAHSDLKLLKLLGLDKSKLYKDDSGCCFFGDELMDCGLYLNNISNFEERSANPTLFYHMRAVEA